MSTPKRLFAFLSLLMVASMVLASCTPPTAAPPSQVTVVVTSPSGTPVVQVITATAPPAAPTQPAGPKTFVVCMAQEPSSLFDLSGSQLVMSAVLEAVQEPFVDTRTYAYQAVGFKKLPSVADGDAKVSSVDIKAGDKVYDAASDAVVTLPYTADITLNQAEGDPVVLKAGETSGKAVQQEATWTLQDGITWEDGKPLTADDFVFGFQVASSPDLPNSKYTIERTLSYTKVDDKSVKWVSLPGYTDNTFFLNYWGPYPKHLYDGKLTPAQMLKDEGVNRKPPSYGPFKVDEWVAGDHIKLSKNPSYWRAKEGLPKVDTLIYRFVPDTNQLIAQLASGECDLGTQDAGFEGSLPLIKQFESQQLLVPQIVAGTTYEHLDFNAEPVAGYNGFAGTVKNPDGTPIFANKEIRQAIAYCLDRQAIIDQGLNGAAVLQDVYVPTEHPLFAGADNVTRYPFDKEKGKALLEKNGWKDTDGDGFIDNGKGQKFSFIHGSTTATFRQKVTQIVQAQLKDNCGIETTIELAPSGEYFADGPDGKVFGRKYDMGEFAWVTGVEPPCDLYKANQIPSAEHGWGAQNNTGYQNDAFDAACTAATKALDDKVKKEQHAIAQKIFSDDLPSIILFARAKIAVARPEVSGVQMDPTANSELWNVENFDINPTK